MKIIQFFFLLTIFLNQPFEVSACNPYNATGWTKGGQWLDGRVDDNPPSNALVKGVISRGSTAGTRPQIATGSIGSDTISDPAPSYCALEVFCSEDIHLPCASPGGTVMSWHEPQVLPGNCYDCPLDTDIPGFQYMGTYKGHRYYCSLSYISDYTWLEADSIAASHGGYIVSINDQAENDLIDSWIEPTNPVTGAVWNIWIGLYYDQIGGIYKWTSGEPVTYVNWETVPGGNPYTLLYGGDGLWSSANGNNLFEWIMEIPCAPNVQQVSGPENGSTLPGGTVDTVTYVITDDFGHSETCSFEVSVASCTPFYCEANSIYNSYEWIRKVRLQSLDYDSNASNYSDFSSECTSLTRGTRYNLAITPGYFIGVFNEYYYVYVDINQDGIFDETNELLMTGYGANTVSGILEIPSSALDGNTRMRIIMSYTKQESSCDWFIYGEVEDYTLQISGSNQRQMETKTSPELLIAKWGTVTEPNIERNAGGEGLFPSPANDFVHLRLNAEKAGKISLILRNRLGQEVLSKQANTSQGMNLITIDLTELHGGYYFLTVIYPSRRQKTMPLLVNME